MAWTTMILMVLKATSNLEIVLSHPKFPTDTTPSNFSIPETPATGNSNETDCAGQGFKSSAKGM
jgi:hypothetical protein